MSITESTFAIGRDIGSLQASIAAKIADGFQPANSGITVMDGLLACRMDKTSSPVTIVNADGAIPVKTGTYYVTKADSAAALTLAAPAAGQVGTVITLVTGSAKAHVLTSTDLIDDGKTGGAKDKATSAAFVGASITLVATPDLHWAVLSLNNYTVAAV